MAFRICLALMASPSAAQGTELLMERRLHSGGAPHYQRQHQNRCTFRALFVCIAVAVNATIPELATAQDRVSFIPKSGGSPITLTGEIQEYTGDRLIILHAQGRPQSIAADQIQSIQTHYDADHLEGVKAFQIGDTQAARELFLAALEQDKREWIDRELLILLTRCALRENDFSGALGAFREVVTTDPSTRHWGAAPLVWTPLVVSEEVKSQTRRMLVSKKPSEQLLGASFLLFDNQNSQAAIRVLKQLAVDINPRISALGKAQLWRLDLADGKVSDLTLQSWKQQIDRFPKEMRGGPQFLLGKGYSLRGDHRRAAAEWMWIPTVYAQHELVTPRALYEAAESTERSGLTLEAKVLYRELTMRFPWSDEARLARTKETQSTSSSP